MVRRLKGSGEQPLLLKQFSETLGHNKSEEGVANNSLRPLLVMRGLGLLVSTDDLQDRVSRETRVVHFNDYCRLSKSFQKDGIL